MQGHSGSPSWTFLRRPSLVTAIIWLQLLVLAVPRDLVTLPIIYASPFVTAFMLIAFGGLRLRPSAVVALAGIVCLSMAVAALGPSHMLNVGVSIATYSSTFLLTIGRARGDLRKEPIETWARALVAVAVFHAVVGLIQLVGAGFPVRLPYRDFSPDVFRSVLGDGGHRLVPLIAGPAAVLVGLRVLRTGMSVSSGALLMLLVVGVVGPGSNAAVLGLAAAATLTTLTVAGAFLMRALRTARPSIRIPKFQVTALAVPLVLIFGSLGIVASLATGGLPHFTDSIMRLFVTPTDSVRSPKTAVALQTIIELPGDVPAQPLVGLGLGNYSSWSQLLLSGVYAERFLDGAGVGIVPVSYRAESWTYVLHHMTAEMRSRFGFYYIDSIATQPWSSWQSLYAEVGLLGLALIAVALLVPLGRLRLVEGEPGHLRDVKLAVGFSLWFVVVMGFSDNLFEYPWLMVPPFLALALLPARRHR